MYNNKIDLMIAVDDINKRPIEHDNEPINTRFLSCIFLWVIRRITKPCNKLVEIPMKPSSFPWFIFEKLNRLKVRNVNVNSIPEKKKR